LNVTSKENVGSTFSFKLPLQVPKDMISNDVYCMMLDKQDVKKYMVEEALTSAKKIGYVQFSTNKSRSSSLSLTPQSACACVCMSVHVCECVFVCVCFLLLQQTKKLNTLLKINSSVSIEITFLAEFAKLSENLESQCQQERQERRRQF
jgi:hypothetical protein